MFLLNLYNLYHKGMRQMGEGFQFLFCFSLRQTNNKSNMNQVLKSLFVELKSLKKSSTFLLLFDLFSLKKKGY